MTQAAVKEFARLRAGFETVEKIGAAPRMQSTMGIYEKPLPPVFGKRYIAPLTAVT